jgi:nitroimidazol reductase NimA-like FMN-containing flavoprotein (pyridoxamine 5'-phosphate oxidase superfamily)
MGPASEDDLAEMARRVVDTNHYMTLGTSDPDGRPRVSPVYFTQVGYRAFYWVSSPTAHHSVNVAARPAVAVVIYDSTAAVGEGRAVYLEADAAQVPDAELPARCAEAFARVRMGGRAFTAEELSGDAPWRLYVARTTRHEVHIPGRHPIYGTGTDRRLAVAL